MTFRHCLANAYRRAHVRASMRIAATGWPGGGAVVDPAVLHVLK